MTNSAAGTCLVCGDMTYWHGAGVPPTPQTLVDVKFRISTHHALHMHRADAFLDCRHLEEHREQMLAVVAQPAWAAQIAEEWVAAPAAQRLVFWELFQKDLAVAKPHRTDSQKWAQFENALHIHRASVAELLRWLRVSFVEPRELEAARVVALQELCVRECRRRWAYLAADPSAPTTSDSQTLFSGAPAEERLAQKCRGVLRQCQELPAVPRGSSSLPADQYTASVLDAAGLRTRLAELLALFAVVHLERFFWYRRFLAARLADLDGTHTGTELPPTDCPRCAVSFPEIGIAGASQLGDGPGKLRTGTGLVRRVLEHEAVQDAARMARSLVTSPPWPVVVLLLVVLLLEIYIHVL
eukprot:TRINITY_DN9997_c0_g1_i1.p1 TRINITY_DN9997_c0_g1~~TRINITY_DN9997_c0_g1_i1.p1  ORF type:complete len:355 (-),score=75.07 TRINITY_DN9997_c0_g1_i1:25-1089(-)